MTDAELIIKHALEIMRLRAALEKIANMDYRGNRSTESTIAYNTLKENK